MKRALAILAIVGMVVGCNVPPQQVKEAARKSSVMPIFYRPVLEISRVVQDVEEPDIEDIIAEKIKEAIEAERDLQKEKRDAEKKMYKSFLTSIAVFGHMPKSRTHIPIGALEGVPSWAKFPENVLVVYKVETTEIKEGKDQYEKDVLTISETANVSPANAKEILIKLRQEGYSISKDEIAVDEEIELIHFSSGWSDPYPSTLRWTVKVSGTEENIIIGYDPRGVLEVKPIPEDKRVDVEVSYFDLEDDSKPKSVEVMSLEAQIEAQKEKIANLEEQMADMIEVPDYEFDITKATIFDLMSGVIKLEQFWMVGGGSGVYLGNMDIPRDNADSTMQNRYYNSKFAETAMNGVVLTNAHVAVDGISMEAMVSADKEVMWIIYPGTPYVKYTHEADRMGTPAAVLWYDGEPVISPSVDAAILVTTPIPGYEQFKAVLGDSDTVKEGQKIASVGNPGMLHKFVTEGVISNKNYNMLQSSMADHIRLQGGYAYDSIVNDSFWIDTPIGIGGVSGSGVWALEGANVGKVVALRNAGLNQRFSDYMASDKIEVDHNDLRVSYDTKLSELEYESIKNVFDPCDKVKYTRSPTQIDGFMDAVQASSGYVPISGLNLCIPINKVKAWLIERGIDLGFRMEDDHWTR